MAGVALLVAAAGLALFGQDYASIFCYAGLGLLFYLGFSGLKSTLVRRAVGGLGVLLC